MTTVDSELLIKARAAKLASQQMRSLPTVIKNTALESIADELEQNRMLLLAANELDLAKARESGLDDAFLMRLALTENSLKAITNGVRNVAALPDPVGEEFDSRTLPSGMHLTRRRVPLGVIGTIFEARPEVPVDISALCLKSGNSVVLRGGKEAINTNKALSGIIRRTLEKNHMPDGAVQMVESTDRSLVHQMVKLRDYIDLLIPRGGPELIHFVANEANMPAIIGGIGVCHTYIDDPCDVTMASNIVFNAKVQAPAKCNALDTVLVHAAVAPKFLSAIAKWQTSAGVELRLDRRALALFGPNQTGMVRPAVEEDWGQEFLGLVLAVKIVDSIEEAMDHIDRYGSGHSEAIITSDDSNARRFVDSIDASVVLVNASTRLNDGGQFGLGAEVAISTNKLHARGPMGLRELTTYKWVASGNGHIRE